MCLVQRDESHPAEWLDSAGRYIGTHGLDAVNPLQRPEIQDGGELTDDAQKSYSGEGCHWRHCLHILTVICV